MKATIKQRRLKEWKGGLYILRKVLFLFYRITVTDLFGKKKKKNVSANMAEKRGITQK